MKIRSALFYHICRNEMCRYCRSRKPTFQIYTFQKAKHLLCRETDAAFELIKTEGILSWLGMYQIDIIGMDDEFGKRDPEYQPELALYQGKTCSMDGYIEQKFGKRYVQIINAMMN